MRFYFGRVNLEEFNGELDSVFEHDGQYFWYYVELEEEQFVIKDTCNRIMPFEYTTATDLRVIASAMEDIQTAEDEALELFDSSMEEIYDTVEDYGVSVSDE